MPLQTQNYSISFAQGIDNKSDPKQIPAGKLLELVNGTLAQTGAINKRYGYQALSPQVDGGSNITNGQALSTYRGELLQFNNREVFSYLSATDKWVSRGTAVSVAPAIRDVTPSDINHANPDMTICNGLEVYAWEEGSLGTVRYAIIDSVTGATIVSSGLLVDTFGAGSVRVVALGSRVYMFYAVANILNYHYIDTANPTVLAGGTVTTDLSSSHTYDALKVDAEGRIYIAWVNVGNTEVGLAYLDSTYALTTGTPISVSVIRTISLWSRASGGAWLGLSDSFNIFACAVDPTLTPVMSLTTVQSGLGGQAQSIAGIEADATGRCLICYDVTDPVSINNRVLYGIVTTSGVEAAGFTLACGVSLISRIFNKGYLIVSYDSTNQSTHFCVDIYQNVIAKIEYQLAGPARSNRMVANVTETTTGSFSFAMAHKGRLVAGDETEVAGLRQINKQSFYTLHAIQGYTLDFNGALTFQSAEIGGNLFVAGGVVQSYDGNKLVEANFHLYPDEDGLSVTGSSPGDGYSYQYVVTYEHTDNNGHIVRSTTSIPYSYKTNSQIGVSLYSVTVKGPNLRLTARENVHVVIYRTEANGTSFYRLTSIADPIYNSKYTDTWSFVDDVPDTTLIGRDRLYTEGGVLDAAPPPAGPLLATYKNRLFVAGLEDPQEIAYSQSLVTGESVNFSPFLTTRTDQRGGNIRGLSTLNDDLIIFKDSAIFRLSGEGPDNTGGGAVYALPQLIVSDVGCSNPNSIALTDLGVIFQSAKGIMLLDRSYAVQYIGRDVEAYNSVTVTSTTVVPSQNIVICTTATDTALVWNYEKNQWSTFSNHASIDSLLYENKLTLLKTNGAVWMQTPGAYTDDGAFVGISLTTPHLNLAGLLGWLRVRQLAILGDFKSSHKLQVGLAFDWNPTPVRYEVIDPTPLNTGDLWGSGANWGSDSVWGGEFNAYAFVYPALPSNRQLCSSISISLTELPPASSSDYGQGLSLSGITLRIGVKPGLIKVQPLQRFGS